MRGLAPLAALALGACAPAISVPVVPPQMAWGSPEAIPGESDEARARRIAAEFPASVAARRGLLGAQLQAKDAAGARETLLWLKARGYAFTPAGRKQVLELARAMGIADVETLFADDPPPLEASALASTVPADALLVESVAVVPQTGALWASAIVSRALFTDNGKGTWRKVPVADAGAIGTVAYDRVCACLWASSGAMGKAQEGDGSFRGVISFDPVTGAERRRAPAPAGAALSDMAIGADGTVYASDPHNGGVYRLKPGAAAMEVLVAPGRFRSPQGLAESERRLFLYVSDYGYGLAAVNLLNGDITQVWTQAGVDAPLDGIDGLWRDGRDLIAVQNGQRPARIVALRLAYGDQSIQRARVLERGNPAWTEPLGGSLVGDALVYVGNGQWDRFGDEGKLKAEAVAVPTEVRRLPLSVR